MNVVPYLLEGTSHRTTSIGMYICLLEYIHVATVLDIIFVRANIMNKFYSLQDYKHQDGHCHGNQRDSNTNITNGLQSQGVRPREVERSGTEQDSKVGEMVASADSLARLDLSFTAVLRPLPWKENCRGAFSVEVS